jgi:hypothetical protein
MVELKESGRIQVNIMLSTHIHYDRQSGAAASLEPLICYGYTGWRLPRSSAVRLSGQWRQRRF